MRKTLILSSDEMYNYLRFDKDSNEYVYDNKSGTIIRAKIFFVRIDNTRRIYDLKEILINLAVREKMIEYILYELIHVCVFSEEFYLLEFKNKNEDVVYGTISKESFELENSIQLYCILDDFIDYCNKFENI